MAGINRYALRYWLAGASRSTSPCSHNCITATAVKVLVTEPIRKTVSAVTGVCDAMSARPCAGERLERSVPHHTDRQADGRPAVGDTGDTEARLHPSTMPRSGDANRGERPIG